MALKTTLEDAKDRLDALLTYANGVTGETDTSIGDAIQTMAQGIQNCLAIEDALLENSTMDEYYNDRVTEVKYYGFVKSNIKVIKLPSVIKIDNSAFDGINDSNVEEIYIPNCVTYGMSSFQRNPKLRIVDFGKANVNTNGRINNCPMLTTLILRNENNLIAPTGATSIQNCPFAPNGAGGDIYVPQSMLSSYQNSQSWADYASANITFHAIEGSIYELTE